MEAQLENIVCIDNGLLYCLFYGMSNQEMFLFIQGYIILMQY